MNSPLFRACRLIAAALLVPAGPAVAQFDMPDIKFHRSKDGPAADPRPDPNSQSNNEEATRIANEEARRKAEAAATRMEAERRARAMASRDLGLKALGEKNWAHAVALLEAALHGLPGDAAIQSNLAEARQRLKEQLERRRRIVQAIDPFSGRGWDGQRLPVPRERPVVVVDAFDPFGKSRRRATPPVPARPIGAAGDGDAWQRSASAAERVSPTVILESGSEFDSTGFGDASVVDLRDARTLVVDPGAVRGDFTRDTAGYPSERAPASPGYTEQPPPRDAAQVRAQIKVLQEAIQGLNSSVKLDGAERREWEATSLAASRKAVELAANMAIDQGLSLLKERVDARTEHALHDAINEVVDPERKKQLGLAFKRAFGERTSVGALGEARLGSGTYTLATGDDEDLERSLSGFRMLCEMALSNSVGRGVSATSTAVDAWLAVAEQATSVTRIRQLNANSEEYLRAMTSLKAKMEDLVEQNRTVLSETGR